MASKAMAVAAIVFAATIWPAHAEVTRVSRCDLATEDGSSPPAISIDVTAEPGRAVAQLVARTVDVRIDGIERVATTPITLKLGCVEAWSVVAILASESNLPALRAGSHFAFGTHAEFAALTEAHDRLAAARGTDDDAALQAALQSWLDVAAVPRDGPALEVRAELDELARLAGRREDFAAAERLQRRRLALGERIDGTRDTPDGLDALGQIATLRMLQHDDAGSLALHREVVEAAARVPGQHDMVIVQSATALGIAVMGNDDVAADRWFARATPVVMKLEPDSIAALLASNGLMAHALTLERLDRYDDALPLLEHNLAIQRAHYGDQDGQTGSAMEDLARVLVRRDELPRAGDLYGKAVAIRRAEGRLDRARGDEAQRMDAAIAALGPFAEREPDAKKLATWRSQLAAQPPDADVIMYMSGLLRKRAERQRAAREPALATTCQGYAELIAARMSGGGTRAELLPQMISDLRSDCLSGR